MILYDPDKPLKKYEVEFKTQKVLNEYWKNEERSTLVECK